MGLLQSLKTYFATKKKLAQLPKGAWIDMGVYRTLYLRVDKLSSIPPLPDCYYVYDDDVKKQLGLYFGADNLHGMLPLRTIHLLQDRRDHSAYEAKVFTQRDVDQLIYTFGELVKELSTLERTLKRELRFDEYPDSFLNYIMQAIVEHWVFPEGILAQCISLDDIKDIEIKYFQYQKRLRGVY